MSIPQFITPEKSLILVEYHQFNVDNCKFTATLHSMIPETYEPLNEVRSVQSDEILFRFLRAWALS
jgi:hypothetical protein